MAAPGTVFEGEWHENTFVKSGRHKLDAAAMFGLANSYAEQLLQIQKQYADWTGLAVLKSTLEQLASRLNDIRQLQRGCLLPLGWSAGFLSKVAHLNTQDDSAREILRQVGFYARAIQSGLPFPKTRRIIFLGNQPAALAGFVHLETF
jgi:CRISPR-associated protein Csm5